MVHFYKTSVVDVNSNVDTVDRYVYGHTKAKLLYFFVLKRSENVTPNL